MAVFALGFDSRLFVAAAVAVAVHGSGSVGRPVHLAPLP